jgi:hypothetical protein
VKNCGQRCLIGKSLCDFSGVFLSFVFSFFKDPVFSSFLKKSELISAVWLAGWLAGWVAGWVH